MKDTRFREVTFDEDGDLVWYGHDLGPAVGVLMPGANEYEFGIPTEFHNWIPTNWDD